VSGYRYHKWHSPAIGDQGSPIANLILVVDPTVQMISHRFGAFFLCISIFTSKHVNTWKSILTELKIYMAGFIKPIEYGVITPLYYCDATMLCDISQLQVALAWGSVLCLVASSIAISHRPGPFLMFYAYARLRPNMSGIGSRGCFPFPLKSALDLL